MDFNYQADPLLAGQRASAEATLAGARSSALEARRQALIAFGSPELARSVLGENDPTLGAISANPDTSSSILGRLRRQQRETALGAEQQLDPSLFYSGARGKMLSDLAYSGQQQEVDAQRQIEQQLRGISGNLAGAEGDYRSALAAGDQGAYDRATQRALDFGLGPGQAGPPGAPGAAPPPASHPLGQAPLGHGRAALLSHVARRRPVGRGVRP